MYQPFHYTGLGQAFQVSARARKLYPVQPGLPHVKLLPDEEVEINAAGKDIAPALSRTEGDAAFPFQRVKGPRSRSR